ncbi:MULTISPECIES: F0F1 ATP synthase subunit B [Rhodobacterales]|uniref:F0F1 ATP synthase subunit B n=1 Tax=Roseobacter sp. N2S TaxID=2663844 RepID=UPI0028591405|nr:MULTISPECIES: F0F1 ATP synthase subunit B [Rhodobacterales]MDR6264006.1 F-type H+-transporting ATPase subunit b [Roseobacter sp. N2S]
MKLFNTLAALVLSSAPAFAASGPFFSLGNTNFVVTIAFVIFVGVLIYLKVPGKVAGLLDQRADDIQSELDEARALREEAQSILATYERKQKEVSEQAEHIIATAKAEANRAAEDAKEDIKISIARRLQGAEDQIASAQAAAIKDVRDTAVSVAIAAASEVIAKGMTAKDAGSLIDDAIKDVGEKLH